MIDSRTLLRALASLTAPGLQTPVSRQENSIVLAPQALVAAEKEPITPFIARVRALAAAGVSTILVVGGTGDYFEVSLCEQSPAGVIAFTVVFTGAFKQCIRPCLS